MSGCTRREWEVIKLIEQGHDRASIAEELDISPSTVRTYIADLCARLNCSTGQIPQRARARGYIHIPPVPVDRRCVVCGEPITSKPREGVADGFCKSACAKQFYGTQALSGPPHNEAAAR